MNLNSVFRISLLVSFILHLLAISLLYFLPQRKVETEGPLIARLVTPEEMATKRVQESGGSRIQGKERQVLRGLSPVERGKKSADTIVRDSKTRGFEDSRTKEGDSRSNLGAEANNAPIAPPSSSFAPVRPQPPITPSRPSEVPKQSPWLPKERLFDKEILDRLARKDKEDLKPDKGITFDTNELKYYSYMQRLKEKIEGIWRYPPEAAEKGIYGDLYIRFTIKRDGRLGNIELLRTSGYRNLDEAAMKALRDAEPFWPLPDEWKKEDLIITGHFIYSLYGVYLR